ncbi:LolA-related protein [Alkalilimnicola sp. S0819]|uniref:LolA-related protein n=1 Tax=Alkalilimnicola sp. S0819 TaxID=2613922 RepID=UPI0012617280|nr:LolA-related protein [Alkalilimnicola sp. S0819]KAB7624180.1 outer membrane lipoprotein carrier protein LolA [Alkalilimnicola sp. S0819]MPQ16434.1 hypothetical protein [Alkalilimnicola sp. S0819]
MVRLRASLLALSLALCSLPLAAAELNLERLLARFAEQAELRLDYRETRHMEMLGGELENSGQLIFRAPDYLRKEQRRPQPLVLEIEADEARILREGRETRAIALSSQPQLAALIGALRATLAGDADALRARYEADLRGDQDDWTLTLTPRAGTRSGRIEQLRMHGSQARVRRVRIDETGDNWTLLELGPPETGRQSSD